MKKRVVTFVIVPMAIVTVCVVLFVAINLLLKEYKSASDYLDDMMRTSGQRRWQAAFALSKKLQGREEGEKDQLSSDDVSKLLSLFEDSLGGDPQLTRYLAIALGQAGDHRAVLALQKALHLPDEDTLIYSLLALGHLSGHEAIEEMIHLTSHQSGAVRQVAVYVLGTFGKPALIKPISARLGDPVPQVRWNSAIALARLGSDAGVEELKKIFLEFPPDVFSALIGKEKEDLKLNAIRAASKLGSEKFTSEFQQLSEKDESLKVRSAALEALKNLSTK
ncbi:MAG: HEAT repeat domain-containing protein [Deltaproteobacteria bacterium]|nr:HEAT repeat domain-containing protein [Deltaproteobacteria bacterium]